MIMLMLAGEKCDGPVLPVFEPDTGFLEIEVIAGFRVWQLAFMAGLALLGLIVFLCCIFRCRVPRTKQEIEADCARKKVTKQFSNHLQKIPGDRMELEKVLPEVATMEEQRIAKGIMEEKLTFFQKLKKALFSSGEDEDEEGMKSHTEGSDDSSAVDIDLEKGEEDIIQTIESLANVKSDRLSSHQEQLAAALKKLHKIRLVQQQLQSKLKPEGVEAQPPEQEKMADTESDVTRGHHRGRHNKQSHRKGDRWYRHGDRSSSGESGRASTQILSKQKTCPQIPTESLSSADTTMKRSASDDDKVKNVKDKRGKRLSRQTGYVGHDIAIISPSDAEEVVDDKVSSSQGQSGDHIDSDGGEKNVTPEARTKF